MRQANRPRSLSLSGTSTNEVDSRILLAKMAAVSFCFVGIQDEKKRKKRKKTKRGVVVIG